MIARSQSKWFIFPMPNPAAAMRLFCLHYAGGSAQIFHGWPMHLPPTEPTLECKMTIYGGLEDSEVEGRREWLPVASTSQFTHNAHHLRELTFIKEQMGQAWAGEMKDLLIEIKQAVEQAIEQGAQTLSKAQQERFEKNYDQLIAKGLGLPENQPPPPGSKREGFRLLPIKWRSEGLLSHSRIHFNYQKTRPQCPGGSEKCFCWQSSVTAPGGLSSYPVF